MPKKNSGYTRKTNRPYNQVRISEAMAPVVLNLIARRGGDEESLRKISLLLNEDFNTSITVDELKKLKMTRANRIVEIRKQIRKGITLSTEDLRKKSNYLLTSRIDRAIEDQHKLENYDAALETGAITIQEYRKKTSTLRTLPTGELIRIMNYVNPPKYPKEPPAQLPDKIEPNSEAAKAMREALQRGDPVEIQRILWNPEPSAQSTTTKKVIESDDQSKATE